MAMCVGLFLFTPLAFLLICAFGYAWDWLEPQIDRWMDRWL